MPGKSRHGKGKRFQPAKKTVTPRQETATVAAPAAAAAPKAAVPVRATPAGKTAGVIANQYAHIPGDLRRIGVLTGVIAVILIALFFILK